MENAIQNVESDIQTKIDNDYYPMEIRVQINLQTKVGNDGRKEKWEYTGCTNEEHGYNNK